MSESEKDRKKIVLVDKETLDQIKQATEEAKTEGTNVSFRVKPDSEETEDLKTELENAKMERDEARSQAEFVARKYLHEQASKYNIDSTNLTEEELAEKISEAKGSSSNTAPLNDAQLGRRSNTRITEEEFEKNIKPFLPAKSKIMTERVSSPLEAISKIEEYERLPSSSEEERAEAHKILNDLTKQVLENLNSNKKLDIELDVHKLRSGKIKQTEGDKRE
jgi:hypothetical protein